MKLTLQRIMTSNAFTDSIIPKNTFSALPPEFFRDKVWIFNISW